MPDFTTKTSCGDFDFDRLPCKASHRALVSTKGAGRRVMVMAMGWRALRIEILITQANDLALLPI
jgi:hypothetical protein